MKNPSRIFKPVLRLSSVFKKQYLFLFIFVLPLASFAQSDDDVSTAAFYAKKYKEDDILCLSSIRTFSFDKGKNLLKDNVVEVQEDADYDFLALKKFASMTYPEYYNKFIQLKTFKRAYKYRDKFVVSDKGGIDRSVTDENIFFDDSRVQYYPMRFSQQGQMQRITVKKAYSDGKYLTRIFFHNAYPVKEQSLEFRVPEWLTVDFKQMNFEGQKIDIKESKKSGYTSYTFTMKDVPAYKSEYRRIGRAYTDPHIIIQIKSFDVKGTLYKGFDKTDDVYAWNNRLYEMAGNETEKLKAQVTKLTQGKTNDAEKVKAIYYWVQDNIRYIAYEDGYSGYIPTAAQDVMENKYGDCKGMANLLTEMLKIAGFDARFSWIGTRHIPYSQTLPALCVNNHAISTLYLGGKYYFLDGTESYEPFNENAFRIQGKEVMIANKDKFEVKTVPLTTAAENKISTKADFVLVNNALNGKVKVTLSGNQRTEFHQTYHNKPSSSQQEYLNDFMEFGNNNMVATNVKTSDLKNRELPVTIDGEVDLSNTVNNITGDKYVGIDFFPKSLEGFIPDEKRVEGYDLADIIQFDDELTLTIPADKKFVDKPDNLELKFDGYEFKGEYIISGNKMLLKKQLSIRNPIIKKNDFTNWTKFIDDIKEFNRYFISITKK